MRFARSGSIPALFSRAPNPLTCRSCSRASLSWSSTTRLRGCSASPCRRHCSREARDQTERDGVLRDKEDDRHRRAHPGDNLTGVNFLGGELGAKQLELIRELVSPATRVAVLVNPANVTVAAFAANATGGGPVAAITATRRRTRSAANSGSRSKLFSATGT
jgi:hypothetical protein